jgi:alpha-tubulin suppressor-like RCC1 family protein
VLGYGQLGNGTNADSNVPVTTNGIGTAVGLGAGNNHSGAVLSDGTARCWGYGESGQLGDGNAWFTTPAPVSP